MRKILSKNQDISIAKNEKLINKVGDSKLLVVDTMTEFLKPEEDADPLEDYKDARLEKYRIKIDK